MFFLTILSNVEVGRDIIIGYAVGYSSICSSIFPLYLFSSSGIYGLIFALIMSILEYTKKENDDPLSNLLLTEKP